MKTLNGVGRVDNATHGFSILEIGGKFFPVMLPGVDDQGVLFLPLGREFQ